MIKNLFFSIILTATSFFCNAQSWQYFGSSDVIKDILVDGEHIWIATNGSGLVQTNANGHNPVFYHKANSGINDNQVSSLAKAPSGTLWIGNFENGVASFDGSVWQHFNKENSGLTENEISSVAVTSDGMVWAAGLSLGLASFEGQEWQVVESTPEGFPLAAVNSLYAEGENLWVGSFFGLLKYNGSDWTLYNTLNSDIPDDAVLDITIDPLGTIWISTFSGIASFDGLNDWITYTTSQNGKQLVAEAVEADADGNIWAGGTSIDGIVVFDGTNWIDRPYSDQQPVNGAITFKQMTDGRMWAGTFGQGLYQLDSGEWSKIDIDQSPVPHTSILGVSIDSVDNKWISTSFGGLAKVANGTHNWTVYDTTNSPFPGQALNKVYADQKGDVWISFFLNNSVARLQNGTWTIYNSINSPLPDDAITAINSDKNGKIWVGFLNKGIASFNGTSWVHYPMSQFNAPDSEVSSISFDLLNTMWVGTIGNGLLKWTGGTNFEWIREDDGLPSDKITDVFTTLNELVIIGTFENGIAIWNGSDWTKYNSSNSSLKYDLISCLFQDKSNKIWIGTNGGGLYWLDGQNWGHFDIFNSDIPDNYIDDLAEDGEGNLWVCGHYAGLGILSNEPNKSKDLLKPTKVNNTQIFPIPTSDFLHIQSKYISGDEFENITILSTNGVKYVMHNQNFYGDSKINVSELKAGIYYLVLNTKDNKRYIHKFIKID